MHRILIALHLLLVTTALLPVFKPTFLERLSGDTCSNHVPLEEAAFVLAGKSFALRSVVAAGLPAFLAFLNLPLLFWLKGEISNRWKALSSMILGLLSTSLLAQLLARYGEGRAWGAWGIWAVSLILMIAGIAAMARLGRTREPAAT